MKAGNYIISRKQKGNIAYRISPSLCVLLASKDSVCPLASKTLLLAHAF